MAHGKRENRLTEEVQETKQISALFWEEIDYFQKNQHFKIIT